MDLIGNHGRCLIEEVKADGQTAFNCRISEKRPIPSLVSMIEEYEDLVRANEICKIDVECTAKEEQILLKELSHINEMLKELQPLYDELEKTIEMLSSQPENESSGLRKDIEEVEGQIKTFEEETRVAVDTEMRKVNITLMKLEESHSCQLEELWSDVANKKEDLRAQISNKMEYLNKKLVEMTEEHERKKEETIKKHNNHLKMRNIHLECKTKEIDLTREISGLEKKIELLEKSSTKKESYGSSSSAKKRKLALQGVATSSGSKNIPAALPAHPALSSVMQKQSDDNQRRRKLFSVNSHFTDF